MVQFITLPETNRTASLYTPENRPNEKDISSSNNPYSEDMVYTFREDTL